MRSLRVESLADLVGIAGSVVCAVHCVAAPTLMVIGSAVPSILLGDEAFHKAMLWFVVPTALLAFGLGCRRHKDGKTILLGSVGLIGMVLSTLLLHDLIGETGERIVVLISAGILVSAHVRNFRCCRAEGCEHSHG